MTLVDGFVLAVPTANRDTFLRHTAETAAVFREYGAPEVIECWGQDVPDGVVTSFPMAVKKAPDETVVFAWIVWLSRQVRDEGLAKVLAAPRFDRYRDAPLFDGKRMIYGGFDVMLRA